MSDVDDALAATDRIGSYKQPTVGEWAAIRLAEEVRTLRARVAELSADPPCAERDHETGAPMPCAAEAENATLRARIAELDADNAAMVRHLDALEDPEIADNEVAHLRARVAELESLVGRVDKEYADDGDHGTGGTGPVWLRATVEQMSEWTEYIAIPRAEWNAMTPRQRESAVDQFGADVLGDAGGYGVSVVDESEVPDDERRAVSS